MSLISEIASGLEAVETKTEALIQWAETEADEIGGAIVQGVLDPIWKTFLPTIITAGEPAFEKVILDAGMVGIAYLTGQPEEVQITALLNASVALGSDVLVAAEPEALSLYLAIKKYALAQVTKAETEVKSLI